MNRLKLFIRNSIASKFLVVTIQVLAVSLLVTDANAETFFCQLKAKVFHDGDGGAVTDHNGTVLFGSDKPKKFNTMIVDHSWIVKKSGEKTLSIKGGPGMPELQFVRSGNDLFYIKDCDNCEKTAILMEKGTTPRLSLHRIRLVGMTAEQYKCTQTD